MFHQSNDFQVTHDFASMLSVRRKTLSKSAVVLQNQEFVEYNHEQMRSRPH